MKYVIAVITCGLTQLYAMEPHRLPCLPAPTLEISLRDLQQNIQLLQKRNLAEIQNLMRCLQIASNNSELNSLQTYLNESIAHLANDTYTLGDALERTTAIRSVLATTHVTPQYTPLADLQQPADGFPLPEVDPGQPKKEKWDIRPFDPHLIDYSGHTTKKATLKKNKR